MHSPTVYAGGLDDGLRPSASNHPVMFWNSHTHRALGNRFYCALLINGTYVENLGAILEYGELERA